MSLDRYATMACMPSDRANSGLHHCPACRSVYRTGPGHCAHDGVRLIATVEDPLVGRVLGGEYLVGHRLGEGAMARVHDALHVPSGRSVAIKTLFGDVAASAELRLRFEREARVGRLVFHRNVVAVLDFLREGPVDHLVLERAAGPCLETCLGDLGPFPEDRALRVLRDVLCGLAALHAHGIVHRDVKPANVLLDRAADGTIVPRLADLGVARARQEHDTTRAGLVVGSPCFMPPEQARGDRCGPAADLYAAGVTLHTLLAGTAPFHGPAADVLLEKARECEDRLGHLPHVRASTRALVRWLAAPRPEDRPATAGEAVAAIDRILSGRSPRRERRQERAALAAAVLLGAAVGSSPLPERVALALRPAVSAGVVGLAALPPR